jgi:diguanylate cyclase (GGDEF)-like protein
MPMNSDDSMNASEQTTLSPDEARAIEERLNQLATQATDPLIVEAVKEIKDAFQFRKLSLADLAYRDRETGLFNRLYLESRLENEVVRAKRYKHPLSLLLLKISTGVRQAARACAKECRKSDTAARFDPVTIAIILPETPLECANRVGEKLDDFIVKNTPGNKGGDYTLHIGITAVSPSRPRPEMLLDAAVNALEKAEERGELIHIAP